VTFEQATFEQVTFEQVRHLSKRQLSKGCRWASIKFEQVTFEQVENICTIFSFFSESIEGCKHMDYAHPFIFKVQNFYFVIFQFANRNCLDDDFNNAFLFHKGIQGAQNRRRSAACNFDFLWISENSTRTLKIDKKIQWRDQTFIRNITYKFSLHFSCLLILILYLAFRKYSLEITFIEFHLEKNFKKVTCLNVTCSNVTCSSATCSNVTCSNDVCSNVTLAQKSLLSHFLFFEALWVFVTDLADF